MDNTTRLPVVRAIAATFSFLAENWLDLLKIVWLPTLVQVLLVRLLGNVPGGVLLAVIIALGTNAMAASGILKLVLRGERPKHPFYIGFGREELRLIGTWCTIALLAVAIGTVFFIAVFAASSAFSAVPVVGALVSLVLGVAMLAAPIWAMLRLSLASPSAVLGPGIGVVPSWRRTDGQVWPLLGYWAVWVLLMLVINWIVYAALLPDYFSGMRDLMQAPVADRAALAEELQARMTAMLDLATPAGAGRNIVLFVVALLGTTLFTLAAGVAWRMTEPAETPTAAGGPWG